MSTLFDPDAEKAFRARFELLDPAARPLWGRMSAPEMLGHLTDGFRIALGETKVKAAWPPLVFYPLRWLFIYTLPWPKGVPTAPEFLQTKPETWEAARAGFLAALDRFLAHGREAGATWAPHPAFGALPGEEWGRLVQKHGDHHFRQFGV
jgi:hypothetical protein